MGIEKKVLDRLIPSAEEQGRIEAAVTDLIGRVNGIIRNRNLPIQPILVGSIAKGTHLTDPDIDLFLRFPSDVAKEEIGRIDKAIGREILKNPEERYAEHTYISGKWQGLRVDLVPCYDVPSGRGRISAVDRTPFHTEYIRKHLKEGQKNEVRLLKCFSKGIGVYGAEAKIRGFSGYLCELLILRFRSFSNLLANAKKWKLPAEFWLEQKPEKEFDEEFVFVDPVDPARNVASPVSPEQMKLFINASKAYKKKPDERFFFPKKLEPWDDRAMRQEIKDNPGLVLIELPALDVVDDVLWPQLRKTGVSIFEVLAREGFAPRKLTFEAQDDANLIMVNCKVEELPSSYIHIGPPAKSPQAPNFLERWKGNKLSEPAVKKGRWQVEVARKERTPAEVLKKRFKEVRLGKGFRGAEKPIIVAGGGLLQKGYRRALTAHLDGRMPWER